MRSFAFVMGGCFLAVATVSAQTSCFDCHSSQDELAVSRSAPRDTHLSDFRDSVHYRRGVGCQDCHGGDGSSYNKWVAHRGVESSRRSASPTHWQNLPATCGNCHATLFESYASHQHFELLSGGDQRAPSCSTCHGDVASAGFRIPANLCGSCHGSELDSTAKPLDGRGGELLAMMRQTGELRRKVSYRIERLKDAARRHELEEGFFVADAPYQEAIDDGHGFRWDDWEGNIVRAREDFEQLYRELKKKR